MISKTILDILMVCFCSKTILQSFQLEMVEIRIFDQRRDCLVIHFHTVGIIFSSFLCVLACHIEILELSILCGHLYNFKLDNNLSITP